MMGQGLFNNRQMISAEHGLDASGTYVGLELAIAVVG